MRNISLALLLALAGTLNCYGAAEDGEGCGKERFLRFLAQPNYVESFQELNQEEKLKFAQSFKGCYDSLEGVAVKKSKLMAICGSFLKDIESKGVASAIRASRSLAGHGDDGKSRLNRFSGAKSAFSGVATVNVEPAAAVVVLPFGALTMAERLDQMRKILSGEREAMVEKSLKESDLVSKNSDASLVARAMEEKQRLIAEMTEIESQLVDATSRFELAQITKLEAEGCAREEADSLDFATKRLPNFLARILGDDPTTAEVMMSMFNDDYAELKRSGELTQILSRQKVVEVTHLGEIEEKINSLISMENLNDAFALIKHVEEKRVMVARSAADLFEDSQRQEAEISAILDKLTVRFRALQGSSGL